jgi:hypothetical protein
VDLTGCVPHRRASHGRAPLTGVHLVGVRLIGMYLKRSDFFNLGFWKSSLYPTVRSSNLDGNLREQTSSAVRDYAKHSQCQTVAFSFETVALEPP